MKLSIHIIYEELFIEKGTLVASDQCAFDLAGIRLFRESICDFAEQYIYIVTPEQYLNINSNSLLHLICIGSPENIYSAKEYQAVLFLPEDTNPFDTLSQIQNLFDRYQEWMNTINHAILQGNSLQYTLDLCSTFLNNPIALFDNQQSLIMKAGTIPDNAEGSLWDYVLKKGYSPKETEFEYFLRTQLKTNPKPFYFRSKDHYRNINRLIAGLHHNRTLFGSLAISDITAPITKSEYAKMCYVQEFMEIAFFHSDEYKSYMSESPWYITQLLQGNPVEKSVISYNFSQIGKRTDQPYFVWTFVPLEQTITDTFSIDDCLPSFNRHFQTNFVFNFNQQIIVVDYQLENYDEKSYLDRVNDYLSLCGFKGAFSMIFPDISELHQAYMQCQIALDYSHRKYSLIFDFRKQYINYILNSLDKKNDINDLLYPGIKRLLQKNESYGLELLHCLQKYIIHGQKVSATAESLYIHRHTVVYRIDTISKIMNINFSTLDEDSLLQLYLSCRILIKHYNESQ